VLASNADNDLEAKSPDQATISHAPTRSEQGLRMRGHFRGMPCVCKILLQVGLFKAGVGVDCSAPAFDLITSLPSPLNLTQHQQQ